MLWTAPPMGVPVALAVLAAYTMAASSPPPPLPPPQRLAACALDILQSEFGGGRQLAVVGAAQWLPSFLTSLPVPWTLHSLPALRALPTNAMLGDNINTFHDGLFVLLEEEGQGRAAAQLDELLGLVVSRLAGGAIQRLVVWLPAVTDAPAAVALVRGLSPSTLCLGRQLLAVEVLDSRQVLFFTVRPFAKACSCSPITEQVGVWDPGGPGGGLRGGGSLFPNDPIHLRGCHLNVATFHIPPFQEVSEDQAGAKTMSGFLWPLLQTLAQALNFTYTINTPTDFQSWGWQLDNGSSTGLFGELQSGRSDMSIAMFTPVPAVRIRAIVLSRPYDTVCMQWAVPVRMRAFGSFWDLGGVSDELEDIVWALLGTSIAYTVLASLVLPRGVRGALLSAGERRELTAGTLLFTLTTSLVGAPVRATARIRRTPLRFAFSLWLFYSMVIVAAYQAALLSDLTTVDEPGELNSLVEVAASPLNPKLHQVLYNDLLKLAADAPSADQLKPWRALNTLLQRTIIVTQEDLMDKFTRLARQRDVLVLDNRATIVYYDKLLRGPRESSLIHRFPPDCDHTLPSTPLAFLRGSPLEPLASRVVSRVREAGLPQKWSEQASSTERDRGYQEPPALSLHDLRASFTLLLTGLALATGVFLLSQCAARPYKGTRMRLPISLLYKGYVTREQPP